MYLCMYVVLLSLSLASCFHLDKFGLTVMHPVILSECPAFVLSMHFVNSVFKGALQIQ